MSESPANPLHQGKKLTKEEKAALKAEKAAAKAAAKAAKEAEAAAKAAEEAASIAHLCGHFPLNQSQNRPNEAYWTMETEKKAAGDSVLVRGRVHTVNGMGNMAFVVLRQRSATVQCVVSKGDDVPKAMVKFVTGVNPESIVTVRGVLRVPEVAVEGTSIADLELEVKSFFIVSEAQVPLPFALADAMTPAPLLKAYYAKLEDIDARIEAAKAKGDDTEALVAERDAAAAEYRPVSRSTRLDNRVLDLRTPANQAIFRIQSGVCRLFRNHLHSRGFMEVHTPKMIGCLSEGGANVFEVEYFGRKAYLAQSPQFYKQMCIASSFDRVFEVAPVFRAEDSNTPRHMTEFIGLDFEMAFNEHYHEVLDQLDQLFEAIFTGLLAEHKADIEIIAQQYPVEPLKFKFPSPIIDFQDGAAMLKEAGIEQSPYEDLSTENERVLGRLVREKYDTDFYRLDKFPTDARPFYTMLSAEDPRFTNSYDFMIRGQEIMSGAQRVHDHKMLIERAIAKEVDLESVEGYTSSFKWGVPPHAGGGVGLNRVTMLFLGLDHICKSTLFPRLPKRLYP